MSTSEQAPLAYTPDNIPVYLTPANDGPGAIMVTTDRPKTPRPTPGASLLASAKRLSAKKVVGRLGGTTAGAAGSRWQQDAWDIYDIVGEQRFLVTTLAGRMGQARIYVGTSDPDTPNKPEPSDDVDLQKMLANLGGGSYARLAQHIYRFGVNLNVAGEVWFVGIPPRFIESSQADNVSVLDSTVYEIDPLTGLREGDDVMDLQWRPMSSSEFKIIDETSVQITLEDGTPVEAPVDQLYLIRIWRPHPNKSWEADSPTRSSLPVLRELVGLTQHIGAQIDSRLAGAGLLVVPASVVRAMREAHNIAEDSDEDPFTDALIDAMTTPITDRDSASAIVPLVVVAPDETTGQFQHITFSVPFDAESKTLREEAINRLAIGQDAPPELLLGTGGMNHWGAWLVREDVVTTHLEPPLALICDALTSQYLHPMMRAIGRDEDEIAKTVIWYDIDHLIVQPTRLEDAERMYEKGLIDDQTMRDVAGFDDSNAPTIREVDQAVELAFDLIRANASLMASPGLPQLVAQIRAVLDGKDATTIETGQLDSMGTGGDTAPADDAPTTSADPASDSPGLPSTGGTADAPAISEAP